ncbi:MAG: ABC transporter ATP-binding protein [Bacteroidota bacterium]
MLLTINHLYKSFNREKVQAVYDTSLQLEAGKTYAFLGESGSGKTTLARLIAGLERPDRGEIYLNERLISSESYHLPAEKRAIGFVFQHYALFPHLTIAKNIEYGISARPDKRKVVEDMLSLISLEGYGKRYPHEISGGQQQRIALARALAPKPRLILLDEPFSNLDSNLRQELRTEVFTILQKTGVGAIFITHNSEDAMAISDEIAVFKDGRLVQKATPEELYEHPVSPYVAGFFDTLIEMPPSLLSSFGYQVNQHKLYLIRNHDFHFNGFKEFSTDATVISSSRVGRNYLIDVKVGEHVLQVSSEEKPDQSEISISWRERDLLVFPKPDQPV